VSHSKRREQAGGIREQALRKVFGHKKEQLQNKRSKTHQEIAGRFRDTLSERANCWNELHKRGYY
jgi:hypothetical protein